MSPNQLLQFSAKWDELKKNNDVLYQELIDEAEKLDNIISKWKWDWFKDNLEN
jgi:hypothetical protein